METVSLTQFRRNAKAIIRKVQRGQHFILTHRGRPAMRLAPVQTDVVRDDDPVYRIGEMAAKEGECLSNDEVDKTLYGQS